MFEVWHYLGWKQAEFAALSAAIEYGKCKGFNFNLYKEGVIVGFWDILNGWHNLEGIE